ncbi:MAG: UDP-4-amino-4,6-dideoxy-N-acetyl-beta-L-altrosamine transaminase [Spirochaetes bacterium]|nr:UDP-4-amino-4,6-dideoxy-N-acetyl-beta-L-altrosamine transaminase [Spirochaetota bacterium]
MKKILPYSRQWIRPKDIRIVVKALKDDFITTGWHIDYFEKALAEYVGVKYAVVVSSASAGLHIANLALGLKKGDEGITSPNTFLATVNSLTCTGAKPRFADIEHDTHNLDAAAVAKKITKRTKVLIPVHYAGHPCEMKAMRAVAKKQKAYIIEDAAHAIGSSYLGKRIGACEYSDMCVFSFHAVKNMTAGEGGAITTNNEEWYHTLKELRSHGLTRDPERMDKHEGRWWYEQHRLGFNYRITDYQAMLLWSQLKDLDSFIARKREIVELYNHAFTDVPELVTPVEKDYAKSAYHLYAAAVDFNALGINREEFMKRLAGRGVGSQVLYIPVHTQPFYRDLLKYKPDDFPNAQKHYRTNIALPLFAKMTNGDVRRVIHAVKTVIRGR